MLKRIYFSFAFLSLIFWPSFSQAADNDLMERYSGTVLSIDYGFKQQYWYLEPLSKTRYALDEKTQLENIVNKFSTTIKEKDLQKIATSQNKKGIDFNIAQKYRGQFLINQEKDIKEIWYVNPLDLNRYLVTNPELNLDLMQSLAIGIDSTKLNALPMADLENFNENVGEINFDNYWEIYDTLKSGYFQSDKIDTTKLFYGSLQGLVESVGDPYTQFFTPQGKKEFDNDLEGVTEGIGAIVDVKDDELTIITPIDNFPAAKAGLLPYDQILKVDDQDIHGYSVDEAVSLIRGPIGTKVKLNIYRPSTKKSFELTITRAKIVVPNVTGKKLDNNLVYIKINTFSASLPSEFKNIKQQLIDNTTKGVIIDLRNNPGGYTNSAIYLADQWLDTKQVIFKEKYSKSLEEYSASTPVEINLPTVILINNGSASASEIFTSALKNYNKATVIGEPSFGKGTGQALRPFADGSALKYTVFEWLDPASRSIEKVGIQPDIEIIRSQDNQFDSQLYQAVQTFIK